MNTPEIVPLFRLKDLGASDELMLKIEAYFVQHLVDLEERRAIEEIPGLDQTEIYMLSAMIRSLHLGAKNDNHQSTTDPGIERLLKEVGKSAAHRLKLPSGFYNLTVERELTIRGVLRQRYLPHSQIIIPCMTLHFGIDGNRPRTLYNCSVDEGILRGYSARRLRELIEKGLKVLAAYLIPMYAKEAFKTADQIPIAYLQLSTLFHNALRRGGIETVADLIVLTPDELLDRPGMGRKGLEEVERALGLCGYFLA